MGKGREKVIEREHGVGDGWRKVSGKVQIIVCKMLEKGQGREDHKVKRKSCKGSGNKQSREGVKLTVPGPC